MTVRAVRGAVRPERDESGHTRERAGTPPTTVPEHDGPAPGGSAGIRSTAVPGPHGCSPAAAAREPGPVDVPPVRTRERAVEGAVPRAVRVPAHSKSDTPRAGIAHVRPGAAAALRGDIAP